MAQTQAGETEEVGLWTRWEGTGCGEGQEESGELSTQASGLVTGW